MISKKNNILNWVLVVLFISVPVLTAIFRCRIDGKSILDIYIPSGNWNDEMSYYKQIEGIIKYGMPRGYYGYNQSTAAIGTLGPWSVMHLIPYALVGKIFGWTYLTPIIANIIIFVITFILIELMLKPNHLQRILIISIYVSMQIITRYVLSSLPETYVFSTVLLFLVSLVSYEKLPDKKMLTMQILIFLLLVLMRPYFLIFTPIIIYNFYIFGKVKGIFFSLTLVALIVSLYVFIVSRMCASYFNPIIDTASLNILKNQGFLSFGLDLFRKITEGVFKTYQICIAGGGGANFYLSAAWVILMNCLSIIIFKNKSKIIFMSLLAITGVYIAILVFYDINVGSRHIIALVLFSSVALILLGNKPINIVLTIGIVLINIIIPVDVGTITIPYYSEEYQQQMIEYKHIFEEIMPLTKNKWENTVSFDVLNIQNYNVLYNIPEGFGIQFDLPGIYDISLGLVNAKYLIASNKGEVWEILKESEAICLYHWAEFSLYLNPKYN